MPAVEVGPEAEHLAPAGEGAGEAHRHQRRLGAGAREADPLGAGHEVPDRLGPAHLERMARAEVGPLPQRQGDRGGDLRMIVAEQERAVAAVIVDVAVAIDVPFVRAQGALDVDAVGLEVAAVVGDAAREQAAGLPGEPGRARRPLAPGGIDGEIGEQGVGHGCGPRVQGCHQAVQGAAQFVRLDLRSRTARFADQGPHPRLTAGLD